MTGSQRRHELIIDALVSGSGERTVAELGGLLGVGEATIRRDLTVLADAGRVVRTYGGAVLPGGARPSDTDPNAAAKQAIAKLAAGRLADTTSFVITGGSTTQHFAAYVAEWSDKSVITNSMDIAWALMDSEGIELAVMGGVVRRRSKSMLGHLTQLAASELRADTLVMGIGAISLEHGLMNEHMQEVLIDRAICDMARRVVVLADSTKFCRMSPAHVVGFDKVTEIITDSRIDPAIAAQVRQRGVELTIAPIVSDPTTRDES